MYKTFQTAFFGCCAIYTFIMSFISDFRGENQTAFHYIIMSLLCFIIFNNAIEKEEDD